MKSKAQISNCTGGPHLGVRYTDCTIPLLHISKISSFLPFAVSIITGQFVSNQAGTSEDQFSWVSDHMIHAKHQHMQIFKMAVDA